MWNSYWVSDIIYWYFSLSLTQFSLVEDKLITYNKKLVSNNVESLIAGKSLTKAGQCLGFLIWKKLANTWGKSFEKSGQTWTPIRAVSRFHIRCNLFSSQFKIEESTRWSPSKSSKPWLTCAPSVHLSNAKNCFELRKRYIILCTPSVYVLKAKVALMCAKAALMRGCVRWFGPLKRKRGPGGFKAKPRPWAPKPQPYTRRATPWPTC